MRTICDGSVTSSLQNGGSARPEHTQSCIIVLQMEMSACTNGFPMVFSAKMPTLMRCSKLVCTRHIISSNIKPFCVQSSPKPSVKRLPRIYLSTNPLDVNTSELRALLTATHQNCDQFPEVLDDGSVKPVDPKKLKRAVLNSTVVVSVHTKGDIPYGDYMQRIPEPQHTASAWLGNWLTGRKVKKCLVGFGRATSDSSFTASIYDIAVAPSLQGLGIGRKILQRIIRNLTSRGIDDIVALCSEQQRPFFLACGFAADRLGSTTMIYTRSALYCHGNDNVKFSGRKSLLIPAPLTPISSKK